VVGLVNGFLRTLKRLENDAEVVKLHLCIPSNLSPWHTYQKLASWIESRNLAVISDSCVMQLWYRFCLVPDSGVDQLEHCSILNQRLTCTWLKWWFTIGCRLLFTVSFLFSRISCTQFWCNNFEFVVYVSHVYFCVGSLQRSLEFVLSPLLLTNL